MSEGVCSFCGQGSVFLTYPASECHAHCLAYDPIFLLSEPARACESFSCHITWIFASINTSPSLDSDTPASLFDLKNSCDYIGPA